MRSLLLALLLLSSARPASAARNHLQPTDFEPLTSLPWKKPDAKLDAVLDTIFREPNAAIRYPVLAEYLRMIPVAKLNQAFDLCIDLEGTQTPDYGRGMQSVLYPRRDRLYGIVNGVDYDQWDPRTDRQLAATYGPDDVAGKRACKQALRREMGLTDGDVPLFGVVARLTEQKGIDLIATIGPRLLDRGWQLAVLGDGDPQYHRAFEGLKQRYPERLGLRLGFDEGLAHRVEAASDAFLMPSAFEPSGLNQLYSLRYGTPPVVRHTGGLADTVTDTNADTLAAGTATGFSFTRYSPEDLWHTVERAEAMWRLAPETWRKVMLNGMTQDWGWDRSAADYEKLYERAVG